LKNKYSKYMCIYNSNPTYGFQFSKKLTYIYRINLLWIILCWTLVVGLVLNSSHNYPNLAHNLSLYNFISFSISIFQFHFSILKLLSDCTFCTIYHLIIMHKIVMIIIFCCVCAHICVLFSNCDVATLVIVHKKS